MSAICHTRRRRWNGASGTPGCWSKAPRRPSPSISRVTTSISVCHTPGSTARSLWSSERAGRARLRPSLIAGVVALGLLAVCFAWRDRPAAQIAPPATEGLQVLLTTSELLVGQNRLAFGLLKDGKLLADARVALRVYAIEGEDARLVAETPARYHRLEGVEGGKRIHIHPDGTRHVHGDATDVQGIYVAQVTLPRPGTWGLEVLAQSASGAVEPARLSVSAQTTSLMPMVGMPAPRSRNRIASDATELTLIDSSDPPDPRLHQTRIADAIAQGKPQVIVFATPRYCTSRVCGPVVDVVRTLIPTYGDRVVFIHQEIWETGSLQKFSPTVEEWNLRSEPWIFVVDGAGMVRARFEGLTTRRELEAALRRVLGPERREAARRPGVSPGAREASFSGWALQARAGLRSSSHLVPAVASGAV